MTVQDALERCDSSIPYQIKPPKQALNKETYAALKTALESIGGKWKGGSISAFVFEIDPIPLFEQLKAGDLELKKDYQFYATPAGLAGRVVSMGSIRANYRVLEPSAGQGALLSPMFRFLDFPFCLDVVEFMHGNFKILKNIIDDAHQQNPQITVNLYETDFLEFAKTHANYYDVIIANPPFTKGADLKHFFAMWDCLVSGGNLVAILSGTVLHLLEGKTKPTAEQAKFLKIINNPNHSYHFYPVEAGAFAESGTQIKSVIFSIAKNWASRTHPAKASEPCQNTKTVEIFPATPRSERLQFLRERSEARMEIWSKYATIKYVSQVNTNVENLLAPEKEDNPENVAQISDLFNQMVRSHALRLWRKEGKKKSLEHYLQMLNYKKE